MCVAPIIVVQLPDVLSIERLAAKAEAGGEAREHEGVRGGGRRAHQRLLPERDGLHVQGARDVSWRVRFLNPL